jgi:hypothetical protein
MVQTEVVRELGKSAGFIAAAALLGSYRAFRLICSGIAVLTWSLFQPTYSMPGGNASPPL